MHDLKEQREKLGRLIQAYRAGSSAAAAGARALEAAPTAAAVMETDAAASMEWSDQQTEEDAWLELDRELARLVASSSTGGGDESAGAALPHQQAVHCPGGQQQPHDDQQAVFNDFLREIGWAEEAVAAPTLAGQQLHDNEQPEPVANGLFQGVVWPLQAARSPPGQQQLPYQQEQAARLPAGQQLQYQQEQFAAHLPARQQPPCYEEEVYFPADQLPRYQEQAVHLPAGQQLPYQQHGVYFPADQQPRYYLEQAVPLPPGQHQLHYQEQDLPAGQQQHYKEQDLPAGQQLHYQQQAVHLPAVQQPMYYCQEQLMANNGGFQGAPPPTLAADLPGDTLMDPWPQSPHGIGWGQEQQPEPPGQRWPGANGDPPSPSFTLPGSEHLGNQNLYGGSNGGRVQ